MFVEDYFSSQYSKKLTLVVNKVLFFFPAIILMLFHNSNFLVILQCVYCRLLCKVHTSVVPLTIIIQREVILGIAEFLWSTCNEDIIITEEILKAGNL